MPPTLRNLLTPCPLLVTRKSAKTLICAHGIQLQRIAEKIDIAALVDWHVARCSDLGDELCQRSSECPPLPPVPVSATGCRVHGDRSIFCRFGQSANANQ